MSCSSPEFPESESLYSDNQNARLYFRWCRIISQIYRKLLCEVECIINRLTIGIQIIIALLLV